MLYEDGEPTAVLIDIETFRQLELLLDNLVNRGQEPEDKWLVESGFLARLIASSQNDKPVENWKDALYDL